MAPEEKPGSADEGAATDLVAAAVEGLWLRLRDVILVEKRLERFVF